MCWKAGVEVGVGQLSTTLYRNCLLKSGRFLKAWVVIVQSSETGVGVAKFSKTVVGVKFAIELFYPIWNMSRYFQNLLLLVVNIQRIIEEESMFLLFCNFLFFFYCPSDIKIKIKKNNKIKKLLSSSMILWILTTREY